MSIDQVPVLITVYNRAKAPLEVIRALRTIKPKKIYIEADGPNPEKGQQDVDDCTETRKQLLEAVDWNPEIKTLFRETNLGLLKAMSGAFTWFFENETAGIILEDDCVPTVDFFAFAAEMLEKYKDDERVMHVSGNCFLPNDLKPADSYYFSQFPYIWGWATWARAWKLYQTTPAVENFLSSIYYKSLINDRFARNYYAKRIRNSVLPTNRKTWSYQWLFALWNNHGLAINPTENLVSNIGSDKIYATNIKGENKFLHYPTNSLSSPFRHPDSFAPKKDLDQFSFGFNSRMTPLRKVSRYLRSFLQK